MLKYYSTDNLKERCYYSTSLQDNVADKVVRSYRIRSGQYTSNRKIIIMK